VDGPPAPGMTLDKGASNMTMARASTRNGRKNFVSSVPLAPIYSFFVEYYVSSMTGAVKQ
jgi:hypothetical protein